VYAIVQFALQMLMSVFDIWSVIVQLFGNTELAAMLQNTLPYLFDVFSLGGSVCLLSTRLGFSPLDCPAFRAFSQITRRAYFSYFAEDDEQMARYSYKTRSVTSNHMFPTEEYLNRALFDISSVAQTLAI
jgi:hypothetical protein